LRYERTSIFSTVRVTKLVNKAQPEDSEIELLHFCNCEAASFNSNWTSYIVVDDERELDLN